MAEHDPLLGLEDLAAYGEQQAHPMPASRVRQLGTQRRHRRYALTVATAAVLVALGGGAIASQLGTGTTQVPNPATTPTITAVPSPARTVSTANLLSTDDVPLMIKTDEVVITDPGVGRSDDTSSVCVPDGLEALGATAMVSRNFRVEVNDPDFTPDPSDPLYQQPSVYTQALQFADADQAEQARRTYQRWVEDCYDQLSTSTDLETVGTSYKVDWRSVRSGNRVVGSFTEVPTYRDRADTTENGYFESVGLTRVEDRLMITIDLLYGNEKHYSLEQGGDSDSGLPEDPQFGLVQAAAQRLSR